MAPRTFPKDTIDTEATTERPGAQAYTLRTPTQHDKDGFAVEFSGIRNGVEFRHNKAVVYDEKVARGLVSDYGYECSPALPDLGPNPGAVDRIISPILTPQSGAQA